MLWRPAAPGLIRSPLPGARLSLASAKGHRYTVLCPCPAPAYLIGGQEWPRGACQEPLSVGPRQQTQGPTPAPLLFEALGRLIGLLCRAPLWGSAQACSSCWVCRRRKEQRLIPLQVSLSVATLHFQWLRKVTSAPDKPEREPHKTAPTKKEWRTFSALSVRDSARISWIYSRNIFYQRRDPKPKAPLCTREPAGWSCNHSWTIKHPATQCCLPPV